MWWFLIANPVLAQEYESQPCRAVPELAVQLAAGTVDSITPRGPTSRMAIASGLLAAPASLQLDPSLVRASAPGLVGDEEEFERVMADARTCVYGAPNLLDGNPATAGCEGASGPGVGEVVMFELPAGNLEIRNGCAKGPERYTQNARARRVEVVLIGQGFEPAVQGTMHMSMPGVVRWNQGPPAKPLATLGPTPGPRSTWAMSPTGSGEPAMLGMQSCSTSTTARGLTRAGNDGL